MKSITSTMFETIKSALAANDKSANTANILKTEPGNTYTLRLLPYVQEPENSFFHYFQHGWNSFSTGQYVGAVSPQTFGERDPIAEARYKLYRGSESDKTMASKIIRSEKWLVNVYVVNDPVEPDNNGKVMILRYGKQLHKVISSAIDGEDAGDLGPRIFDLGPDGVNLKVVVEKQGDYPLYTSSKFSFPCAIPNLNESQYDEIFNSAYDLKTVFTLKSFDELQQMVNEHIYCVDTDPAPVKSSVNQVPPAPVSVPVPVESKPKTIDTDDEIKDLLAGLDL